MLELEVVDELELELLLEVLDDDELDDELLLDVDVATVDVVDELEDVLLDVVDEIRSWTWSTGWATSSGKGGTVRSTEPRSTPSGAPKETRRMPGPPGKAPGRTARPTTLVPAAAASA